MEVHKRNGGPLTHSTAAYPLVVIRGELIAHRRHSPRQLKYSTTIMEKGPRRPRQPAPWSSKLPSGCPYENQSRGPGSTAADGSTSSRRRASLATTWFCPEAELSPLSTLLLA
eukprot:6195980-Pyramimonas_sp.AAC.1